MKQKSYEAKNITKMADLEHMRKRAAMYMGDIHSASGHNQLMKEAFDNAADEASVIQGKFHIRITLVRMKDNYQVIVTDTGRGIPLQALAMALTEPRSSGKSGTSYDATAGVFGLGIKGTCAMSKLFAGVSTRPDGSGVVVVRDLDTVRYDINGKYTGADGTVLFYEPSKEWMQGEETYLQEGISELLEMVEVITSFLPNTVSEVCISDKRVTQKLLMETPPEELDSILREWPVNETLLVTESETPMEMIKRRFKLPEEELWSFNMEKPYGDGPLGYKISLFIPSVNDFSSIRKMHLIGAVNRKIINDPLMHHIYGCVSAVKRKLEKYFTDSQIRKFFLEKYTLPISGIIYTEWKEAVFGGQTKREFKNKNFLNAYVQSLSREIQHSPQSVWDKLYALISEHVEICFHQYHNKTVISGSFSDISARLSAFNAYKSCREADPMKRELFIAEGASAGGQISQMRDVDTQAVFYLKGKSINPIRSTDEIVRKNAVVSDLVTVIGVPVGAKDLSTLNFGKIIIITDADDDGHHITALLVSLFYRMNPALFDQKIIHIASPPLYALKTGKKSVFLRDRVAMTDFMSSNVYAKSLELKLQTRDGNRYQLDNDKFRDFVFNILRIGEIYDTISNRLVIEPSNLEMMACVVQYLDPLNTEALRETLGYDSVTHEPVTNCLILNKGDVETVLPLNRLAEEIKAYILPELQEMLWDHYRILVTTRYTDVYRDEPCSFYKIYCMFKALEDIFTVSRYKGLGEMSKDVLKVSSLDPETRTTLTVAGVGDVEKIYAMMGADPSHRKRIVK